MAPYSGAKFSKKVGGASKKSRNNEVKSKSKDTVKNVAKKSMKNTTKKEFDHSALPRDDGGRLLKTVGAVGLAAGGVAYDGETGLAVRVERSVPPLITLEMVEAARGFLAKGEIHLACAALRHDDASTIKVILTAWENKKANDTDTSTLSETARLRVSNDAFSTLHSAFTIERIGESSLPLEFIGRRFLDGDELLSTADVHLTYSLLVADEGRWLRAPDLKRLLTARMDTLRPVGQIKLNNDLTVSFSTELVGEEDCDSHRYRVVEHAAADASLVSAASIVLALPKSLAAEPAILDGGIAPESMSVEEEYQEPTQVGSCFRPLFGDVVRGCSKTLFRVPCLRSKLSKALCRGRPLCGDAEDIIAPLRDLLELDICDPRSGESGTAATLGCFLVSGLASSSPWIHGALSLPVVMALWLCAAADRQLRFAAFVTERLEATALGLWARDDPEALWPWRGWRDKEPKPIVFSEWECMNEDPLSQCRDALRAALLLGCVTATSAKFAKTLFARVLGKLLEGSVDLLQLPSDVRSISNTIQALKIEARLAAYDNTLRPSFLILMQACLSYPPRVPELHYLKSLAEAVHRLSSGINARAARQCLDGAIDTSRFTSFLDSSKRDFASNFKSTAGSSSSEMSKTPKLMFPTWSSASEAVRLTAAEKDLYRIVLSVQSELAHALQDTDCGKPTHQRSHFGQLADRAIKEALEYSSTTEVEDEVKGRKPTAYEAKAAFLTLFGERQAVKLLPENHNYWAMFMGDGRLAIQRDSDEPRKYLDPNSDTHTRVAEVLLSEILAPPGIAFPSDRKPPVGFSWNFLDPNNDEENLHISVVRQHNGRYSFYIGDLEVPAGDATPALSTYGWSGGDSANYQIPSDLETLIRRGLYLDEPSVECDLSLIASLDAVARGRLQLDKRCFEWLNLAKSSPINRNAWRDALVKLNCRTDSGLVSMATCSRDGSRGGNAAVSQFEGLVLRIYYILAALYPAIITRVTELQFIIDDSLGLHFIHLLRNLNILAFSYFDDGSAFSTPLVNEKTTPIKTRRLVSVGLLPSRRSPHFDTPEPPALAMMMDSDSDASDDAIDEQKAKIIETPKKLSLPTRPSLNLGALPDGGHATLYAANWIDETEQDNQAHEKCPEITTTLWSHQREARDNIIFGIKTGKRGFADASTVGAGKSLTALSVCCAVNKLLLERAVRRCGCLILCPTISLITEWCQQAMLHTSGFEVIVQRANGALMSKGWTTGSGRAARTQAKTVALGSSSLVITTLSRNREHPFTNQPLFDLCVIDECLSVQSESAMQAAEAWRSVSSSRCGCLMLSATLFRSSYKSLFYLIRMLRSPIPRTPR
uniref:Helicase ATP-binding domain-containing protein n=1 Tax=Aureoumbra lagunensis TaxID=44058 RepID=A0A7S3NJE0_9STRA